MRTALLMVVAAATITRPGLAQSERYVQRDFEHAGREYVAVVVGSSHCGFSTWDKFMVTIDPMLQALRREANQRGALFTAIGVAIDDAESGIAYLAKMARFDEVIAGGTWLNTGAVHYLWGDGQPEPRTPSLVLLERTFSDGFKAPRRMDTRLLKHLQGTDSIMAFAKRGAPLPE